MARHTLAYSYTYNGRPRERRMIYRTAHLTQRTVMLGDFNIDLTDAPDHALTAHADVTLRLETAHKRSYN